MAESVPTAQLEAMLLSRTADIVAAYVARNNVNLSDICDLIATVHASLGGLAQGAEPEYSPQTPAVPVKKSIKPDYLICLEDGKRVKMLKRYLRTAFGMTPAQYRVKWGLPLDYPMAAPNYTQARSDFAKKVGFGTKKARLQSRK
jgi:predicted transcriptional regulator